MGSPVNSQTEGKVAALLDNLRLAGYSGDAATPSSDAALYSKLRERWSTRSEVDSPIIVAPANENEVELVVRAARQVGLDVSVRSGGHSAQKGAATETGVQIHLGKLQSIRLDRNAKIIHVQGGCLWDHVYKALEGSGLIAVGGGVWMVGVGGYLTGGGYSFLSAKYGMACDQVVAARVVTGEGEVVECDARTKEDLFWGIRGGSSNFGIVTEFSIRLHDEPAEKSLVGVLGFPGDRREEVMKAVQVSLLRLPGHPGVFYLTISQIFYGQQTDSEAIVVTYARPPPHRHVRTYLP